MGYVSATPLLEHDRKSLEATFLSSFDDKGDHNQRVTARAEGATAECAGLVQEIAEAATEMVEVGDGVESRRPTRPRPSPISALSKSLVFPGS